MAENMLQPSGAETWLCVRDALFMLAHDEDRGFRRRLHPVTLDFALSAAVLCDLVLCESADVTESGHVFPGRPPEGSDTVTAGYYTALHQAARSRSTVGAERGGSTGAALPLREVLYRFAADATARTQALLTASDILAVHRDWLGRARYSLLRPELCVSSRLPARDAVIGEPTAIGVTLCALVQALGLHDALLLIDRSELDPALTRIVQRMRQEAPPPVNTIPLITDALRAAISERVAGVFG